MIRWIASKGRAPSVRQLGHHGEHIMVAVFVPVSVPPESLATEDIEAIGADLAERLNTAEQVSRLRAGHHPWAPKEVRS